MPLMDTGQKTTRTKPHLQLLDLLEKLGYEVEEEKSFPPYSVDAYLPGLHVAFEADGPTHQQKSDAKRDLRLMGKYALPVYRLSSIVLDKQPEELLKTLVSLILAKQWKDSTMERRTLARDQGWTDD